MKHIKRRIAIGCFILGVLAATGCCHEPATQISVSTPDRKMSAVFDVHATFKTAGDGSVISFGHHKLVLSKEWLILDGGKGKFGIPEMTRKIEIQVKHDVLTLSADGNNVIKTPI